MSGSRKKLYGLKKIAVHLDASEKSVRTWRNELDLPVYLSGKRRYFAYSDELDQWEAKRRPTGRYHPRLVWSLVGFLALVGVLGLATKWVRLAPDEEEIVPGAPVAASLRGRVLDAVDADGRLVWRADLPNEKQFKVGALVAQSPPRRLRRCLQKQ